MACEVYLAAPLFSEAERTFNRSLVSEIETIATAYLPERDGALMPDLLAKGYSASEAMKMVFNKDIEAIRDCSMLIAVLDGRVVDEGVAVELGFAFAIGKPCIGLKTDFRQLSDFGDNPMIEGLLESKVYRTHDLISEIRAIKAPKVTMQGGIR